MLGRAEALEAAVDHDAHPGAEGLALLHGVRRQDDGLAAPNHFQNAVPQKPPRPWVHARGGFILKKPKKF